MTALAADEQAAVERESLVFGSASTASACADGTFVFHGRPAGLAADPNGSLFVSDATSRTIWRIGDDGAPAVDAAPVGSTPDTSGGRVLHPAGLALASDGTLLVADTTGHRIWAVSPIGSIRLVAGSAYGYRDGPGAEALFRFPSGVAIGPDGTCYVADTGSDRIRTITPDGLVATLAGSIYDYGDGRGAAARFRRPEAITVDSDGTCYVADTGNNAIRRISPDGEVTTLAGAPPGGDRDGVGAEVGLRWPTGLALGGDGELWVADHGNGALRRFDHFGASTTPLRLPGRHWPVAVARAPDGAVIVAVAVLDDVRRPQACLISVGAGG
jgi:sugar lactone lactonase YvrE